VKEILKHPGLPVEKIKTLSSAFKKPFINEFPFHLKCVLEHSRELVIMIKEKLVRKLFLKKSSKTSIKSMYEFSHFPHI